MGGTYQQAWDDCLDAVLSILCESKCVDEVRYKVEQLQLLIKSKKFETLRSELGVIGKLF